MSVTQADVARIAKVSQSAVSHVLNGRHAQLSPDTVAKIKKALREANYSPHLAAVSLRKGRSGFLGLILPNLRHQICVIVARRVHQLAEQKGYRILTFCADDSVEREKKFLAEARSLRVEGLVVMGGFSPPRSGIEHLQKVVSLGMPMVILNSDCGLVCARVTLDIAGGMEAVVKHLLSLGHRHLAFAACGRTFWAGRERWVGIQRAYRASGLEPPGDEHFYGPFSGIGPRAYAAGQEATEAILARRAEQQTEERYTAIVAMNDEVAFGAIRCLVDHNLDVPKDISVVGFDGMDQAMFSVPRLTTFSQPIELLAQVGFESLIEQIEQQGSAESRVLTGELVVGESTGKAPKRPRPGRVTGVGSSKTHAARQFAASK